MTTRNKQWVESDVLEGSGMEVYDTLKVSYWKIYTRMFEILKFPNTRRKVFPSQLARSPGDDAAWRSAKLRYSTLVDLDGMASDGWLKKVQKLNPVGGCDRGRPKTLGRRDSPGLPSPESTTVAETHPSEGNLGLVHLEVPSDWTHPYLRD